MTIILIHQRLPGSWSFMLSGPSQSSRRTLSRRVKAGLENAKRKGKKLGRPGIDDSVIEEAKILRGEGKSFRKIGKQLGISEGVVRQRLKGA